MVKKTKLFAQLPKFGCLLGNNSASLKISGILPQKQASFETGGRTYFTLQGDRSVQCAYRSRNSRKLENVTSSSFKFKFQVY